MAKMANTLKELDRSAEENCKKSRDFLSDGRFEEALAAYGEADEAWRKMADLLLEKGKEDSGKRVS